MVWDVEFGVYGSGFEVGVGFAGLGCRVEGLEFGVSGKGLTV